MTPDEQDNVDRIERDRRRRERELLALLLALLATSRSHAIHADRLGHDAAAAATTVLLGDNGGFFVGMAPLIVAAQDEAYDAGFRRAARLTGTMPIPEIDAGQKQAAIAEFQGDAQQTARELADTISAGIRDVTRKAMGPKEELEAMRFVFRKGQLTREHPGRLEARSTAAILEAYNAGLWAGYFNPFIRPKVVALRHVSVIDNSTTAICRERHGITLPVTDDYWLSNWPGLHWGCRSCVLPILVGQKWEPTHYRPINDPQPGFGQAPAFVVAMVAA